MGVRQARLIALLAAALVGGPPSVAWAHGGTDHGERVVDGELVEVPVEAAPSVRSRALAESWRGTGPRPLAIVQILMPGRDVARYPELSESALRQAFVTGSGSASRALSEMTDGTVSLTGLTRTDGDVLPTVTASVSGGCRWQQWASEAKTALSALGHPLTSYLSSGNVAYVLRGPTGCSWGGLAWMPGTEVWLANSVARSLVVHELGHNLSLDHATSARCRDGSGTAVTFAAAASCTLDEYGDPFDPMGDGTRHFSAPNKVLGGWLPSSAVRTVTATGTYDLNTAGDPDSDVRMLRVPRPDGRELSIELRRPFGVFDAFSAGDPAVNGVLLRLQDPGSSDERTWLLDAVPSTATFSDAALAVGRTASDPVTGTAVRLDALEGDVARLSISLEGAAALPPVVPLVTSILEAVTPPVTTATPTVTTTPPASATTTTTPTAPVPPPPPAPVGDEEVTATTPPPAVRAWRRPSSITVDGRRRDVAVLSRRGVLRGRTITARFATSVREVRVRASGCTARVAVRVGGRWRTLSGTHAPRAVRDVRVACARTGGRATVRSISAR